MTKRIPILIAVLTGMFVLAIGIPQDAYGQGFLRRISAEWRQGGEQVTGTSAAAFPGAPDGTVIYQKTVFTGFDNTIYITFESTGDTHNGAASWFSCRIINAFGAVSLCRTPGGGGSAGAPFGWVAKSKHFNYNTSHTRPDGTVTSSGDGGGGTGDIHDNSLSHEWCGKVRPFSLVTVQLRMATSDPGNFVFIENSNFYIDSNIGFHLCEEVTGDNGVDGPDLVGFGF